MPAVVRSALQVSLGRPLSDAEWAQSLQWGEWALRRIERRAAKLGRTAASLDPEVLEEVLTEAVTRRLRAPEPVTQLDVQVDDGSVSKRFQASSGLVEILPEWWDDLGLTDEPRGAFSIRPHGDPDMRTLRDFPGRAR